MCGWRPDEVSFNLEGLIVLCYKLKTGCTTMSNNFKNIKYPRVIAMSHYTRSSAQSLKPMPQIGTSQRKFSEPQVKKLKNITISITINRNVVFIIKVNSLLRLKWLQCFIAFYFAFPYIFIFANCCI